MKLSFRYILFLCVCMFALCVNKVFADTYPCIYTYGEKQEKLTFSYDIDAGTYSVSGEKQKDRNNWYRYHYYFSDDEIKDYGQNKCPTLHMFYINTSMDDTNDDYHDYSIFSSTYLLSNSAYVGCLEGKDNIINTGCMLHALGADTYKYYEMHLSSDEENKDKEEFSNCPQTSKTYGTIRENYESYKKDGGVNYIIAADKEIEKLRNTCGTILTYMDYYLSNGVKEACVDFCLNMDDEISKLKKEYGIPTGTKDGECGFSEKLILFIANIVKWIKYIIPVIVIVLGILDFIQAIAADKDDMMKKAQGRFVKRLIAAALIFIIPFIIEFVLDKMGFSSNGCGIIDL